MVKNSTPLQGLIFSKSRIHGYGQILGKADYDVAVGPIFTDLRGKVDELEEHEEHDRSALSEFSINVCNSSSNTRS